MDADTLSSLPPHMLAAYLRDPRLAMAADMQKKGSDTSPVQSPWQGLARMVQGGLGGYQEGRVEGEFDDRSKKYTQALSDMLRSGGDINSMIQQSASNPDLADIGKDLLMKKIGGDYEVSKLMAVEKMKNQLDPEKAFISQILGGGQPTASPPPLAAPPSGQGQYLPPVPAAPPSIAQMSGAAKAVTPPMNASDLAPPPASPYAAMGAQVQPPPAFDNTAQPAPASPMQGNDVQSAMLEKYLGKPREGMMWALQGGQPAQVPSTAAPKMTDDQAKAAGFYDRMTESNPVFSDENKVKAGTDLVKQMKGSIPIIGNSLNSDSPDYQQFDQGQRNFINAVLRRESGAAISPSEFDNARKQYIPQPGDGPDVLVQKEQNRQTATQGMMRSAGPGFKPTPHADPEEGKTATNPQTGAKLIKKNGEWVPL